MAAAAAAAAVLATGLCCSRAATTCTRRSPSTASKRASPAYATTPMPAPTPVLILYSCRCTVCVRVLYSTLSASSTRAVCSLLAGLLWISPRLTSLHCAVMLRCNAVIILHCIAGVVREASDCVYGRRRCHALCMRGERHTRETSRASERTPSTQPHRVAQY